MKAYIKTFSPAVAKEYLEKNTANYRKVNWQVVDRYAKDMADGMWLENGSPIAISKSGKLLDGQHRLYAIIKSGLTMNILVVEDVDDTAITTYDDHSKRTDTQAATAADIGGYARSTQALSMTAILLTGSIDIRNASKRTTKQHKLRFLNKNQVEVDAVAQAVFCGANTLTKKASVLLGAWCLFVNGEKCEKLKEFFSVVNNGFPIDGKDCSPCIVLRNQLLNERAVGWSSDHDKKDFNSTIRAYVDFKKGNRRKREYEPMAWTVKYFDSASRMAVADITEV